MCFGLVNGKKCVVVTGLVRWTILRNISKSVHCKK